MRDSDTPTAGPNSDVGATEARPPAATDRTTPVEPTTVVSTANDVYPLPGFFQPFSALSHLLGAVIFLIAGTVLVRRVRWGEGRKFFVGLYVFSVVFLLSMSGVYHMMERGGTPRMVMERLDHSAIFLLIAGTFTPVHGLLLSGWRRWAPLLMIWTAAITGITLKAIFFNDMPEALGLSLYLMMGWFGVVSGVLIAKCYGWDAMKMIILGGVAYSLGGVMEFLSWGTLIPGVVHPHELFHLFVLIGIVCHWMFVRGVIVHPPKPLPDAPPLDVETRFVTE
ncbi:MAG: hemolysin III family protein [Pirellulales bacterium]